MEPTADEDKVIQAFARRIAAGSPHSVIWMKELRVMTGLDVASLDRAVDSLNERGWLICAGNEGWHSRDFCALIGEGSERAARMAGVATPHAAAR
jgi:DNA-binding MarR family transcriptional regulator